MKELRDLLSRAIGAIENPNDLSCEEMGYLVDDLQLAQKQLDNPKADLTGYSHDRLRYLKRRVKEAKREGRTTYKGVTVEDWSIAIREQEIVLGIGSKGGRPVEPV